MRMRAVAALLLLFLTSACTPMAVDYEQVSRTERMVARFSHVTAENSPKHLAAMRFAEAASERAAGRLEVQVYPNSQLYPDVDELAALQEGRIHFIAVAPSKLVQFDPSWQVYDLPYLFSDFEAVERLFESPVGMQMRQRLEAKGLKALSIWPNGFMHFTNSVRPLVTPEDFQGLTFRVQSAHVLQDQYAALGATAVVSSFSSVYAQLESGRIDGQENTPNNIFSRNLHRVQPFLTVSAHRFLAYVVIAQASWWNALDPEMRSAMESGLTEGTAWARQNAGAMNAESLEKVVASGLVQVRTLTAAERAVLERAFEPAYRAVAARLGAPFLNQVIASALGKP